MRCSFILTSEDLRFTDDSDAQINLIVACPIPFQDPPLDLVEVTSGTGFEGAPTDLSVIVPMLFVTPLCGADILASANSANGRFGFTNAASGVPVRLPKGLTPSNPTQDAMGISFVTTPLVGGEALPGSFLLTIDWSHSASS